MESVVIIEPHPVYRLGLRQLLSDAVPQASIRAHDYSSFEETPEPANEQCSLLLLSLTASRCSVTLTHAAQKRFAPDHILLVTDGPEIPDFSLLPDCVAGSVTKQALPQLFQASVQLVLAGGSCFPAHVVSNSANRHTPIPPPAGTQAGPNAPHQEPQRYPAAAFTPAAHGLPHSPLVPPAGAHRTDGQDFGGAAKPGSTAHRESRLLGLTPRQYEVLVLLARGYPMKTVGRTLNISVATAKAHTETLYQRLDVHNRNAAVYAAVSRGATLGWAHMLGGHGESSP